MILLGCVRSGQVLIISTFLRMSGKVRLGSNLFFILFFTNASCASLYVSPMLSQLNCRLVAAILGSFQLPRV